MFAGRFVLFWGDESNAKAITDVCAQQMCAYTTKNDFIISSHARLIADIINAKKDPLYRFTREYFNSFKLTMYSFPNGITRWENVSLLSPNIIIDCKSRTLTRFWHYQFSDSLSTDEAVDIFIQSAQKQIHKIFYQNKHLRYVSSLTAGIDSRVTVSLLRDYLDKVTFFTYPNPVCWSDILVAKKIAKDIKLKHIILPVEPEKATKTVKILERSLLRWHKPFVVHAYTQLFPDNPLFLRSNISEIGRKVHYQEKMRQAGITPPGNPSGWFLACMWLRFRTTDPDPAIAALFDDWIVKVELESLDWKNVDLCDIFFMEHHMAFWLSTVNLETDFAMTTHAIFNCRSTVSAFLRVPYEERSNNNATHRQVIDRLWPELNAYPVNPTRKAWKLFVAEQKEIALAAKQKRIALAEKRKRKALAVKPPKAPRPRHRKNLLQKILTRLLSIFKRSPPKP